MLQCKIWVLQQNQLRSTWVLCKLF